MTTLHIPPFLGHDFPEGEGEVEKTAEFMAEFYSVLQLDHMVEELSMAAAEGADDKGVMQWKHHRWLLALQLAIHTLKEKAAKPKPKPRRKGKPLTKAYTWWDGSTREYYTAAGLASIADLITEAQRMVDDNVREMRADPDFFDGGTCVGGAGIQVTYFPPRCRKPQDKVVVRCNSFQGNISIQKATKPALEWLKAQGVDCRYYDGWMD